jgi:hypothetical protein
MKLPKLEYGKHEGKIVAEEMLQQIAVNGTNVYAKLKLVSKISIVVPYPEKYVDVSLDAYEKKWKTECCSEYNKFGYGGNKLSTANLRHPFTSRR